MSSITNKKKRKIKIVICNFLMNRILFEKLKDLSSNIQNGVEVISQSSTNILKNFETLKNKKTNLEDVLNAVICLKMFFPFKKLKRSQHLLN